MLPSLPFVFSDTTGDDVPLVSVFDVEDQASASTAAERAGYVDWTRFAPVLGDTLWRDDGQLPSGDGFTLWLACEL